MSNKYALFMENLFLKKLELILFKYFLSKVINLDFPKKNYKKSPIFLKKIFLDEINTNIL